MLVVSEYSGFIVLTLVVLAGIYIGTLLDNNAHRVFQLLEKLRARL